MTAPAPISRTAPPGESGAALMTVLLLVAILSVIAAIALERLTLASRMTRNIVSADQGRAYLLAAEQIASLRIADLVAARADRTTLEGGWLGVPQPMVVPGGTVTARVADGGNCFNLNSLVRGSTGSSQQSFTARPEGMAQFANLMRLLGVDSRTAEQVAGATADWIDSDNFAGPNGAEDDYYAQLKPAYRTANNMMADPSELRMVSGVTPELYQRLRPWLCTLPVARLSPINVNTLLPGQAVLLAMIEPNRLGIETARQLLAQRPAGGYGSMPAFWQQGPLAALSLPEAVKEQFQQKSRWFEVSFSADLGGDKVEEIVLYDAGSGPARVVRRQWSGDGN